MKQAAGLLEPEADTLAPVRTYVGEDTGQPAVAMDVDGILVAAAAERDVGDRPRQMMLAIVAGADPDGNPVKCSLRI